MNDVYDLYTRFLTNNLEMENLNENILTKEAENDLDKLENLYGKEFHLIMEHISIYEDLQKAIANEPKTLDNEFELAKIKRDADKLLKVEVVEI